MEKETQKIDPKELTMQDVKQYICPEATEKEAFMFLQIAKSCNLNPFLSQIYLVKYGNQKAQILTSYNVYLQRAERSKKYAGLETRTEGSVTAGDLKAIVKVYRKDWKEPLTHEVYYKEYVQLARDKQTGKMRANKFWATKPRTMIIKVAISQAFRLAFPLDFEGMPYTSDEINTIDADFQPQKAKVSMPKTAETPQKEVVVETEINEQPQNELPSEEQQSFNEGQSGAISVESCKNLTNLAKMNGYTKKEVYEIIFALGYTKVIDILKQDYDTIIGELSIKAEVWRKSQEQTQSEIQDAWDEE